MADQLSARAMVLMVLEENPEGLDFDSLYDECGYTGLKIAFESLLSNLKRNANIYVWLGRFHHAKYLNEKDKVKRVNAKAKAKKVSASLNRAIKKINTDLPAKMIVIDQLMVNVRPEQAIVLSRIKSDLEYVSNAGI